MSGLRKSSTTRRMSVFFRSDRSVTVISQEITPSVKKQTFSVPLRNAGELIQIGTFYYP
jgi:uncharacterized protein YfaP (DUF2135 family)